MSLSARGATGTLVDSRVAPARPGVRLRVADLVFAIDGVSHAQVALEDACRDFITDAEPDVRIDAEFDRMPSLQLDEDQLVFDSEALWKLYRTPEQHVFVIAAPAFGPDPYAVGLFEPDFSRGKVFDRRMKHPVWYDDRLPNPLSFPISEVLMISLLSRGLGIMAHACGIVDGERGYLFAGNSTHGKSTMAAQWLGQGTVLNDDRIVLRFQDGRLMMYGTPWHGAYSAVSPRGVPLERIFFLSHASEHTHAPLSPTRAATHLMTRCFPPLWSADGMAFTLQFIEQVMRTVPAHALGFHPDPSIVQYVRCVT